MLLHITQCVAEHTVVKGTEILGILRDNCVTNTVSLLSWVEFLIAHVLNEFGICRLPFLMIWCTLCYICNVIMFISNALLSKSSFST